MSHSRRYSPLRRAFTLVELLIVIAIIGVLMGLLLPAIQAAREKARQTTCRNNQRNLALAVTSYTTNSKGTYPGWAQDQKVVSGTDVGIVPMPWTAKLLNHLDSQTLYDQIVSDNNGQGFNYTEPPVMAVFQCPSDASTNPDLGTLSFVINCGMPDPLEHPVPTDLPNSDFKANGICHDLRNGRKAQRVTDIKDGADSTLLISENVHRDVNDIATGRLATWLGPVQKDALLANKTVNDAVDMDSNPEQRFGMVWVYDDNNPVNPDVTLLDKFSRDTRSPAAAGAAYGQIVSGVGSRFARPASEHPEIFIAAFCGGSTRDISENIEFRVYQQLMTPDGQKAAVPGPPPLDYLIEFMNPPLSNSDY